VTLGGMDRGEIIRHDVWAADSDAVTVNPCGRRWPVHRQRHLAQSAVRSIGRLHARSRPDNYVVNYSTQHSRAGFNCRHRRMEHSHMKHSPDRFAWSRSLWNVLRVQLESAGALEMSGGERATGRCCRPVNWLSYTHALFGCEQTEDFLQIFTLMFYYCSATPKHDPASRDIRPPTASTPSRGRFVERWTATARGWFIHCLSLATGRWTRHKCTTWFSWWLADHVLSVSPSSLCQRYVLT